LASLRFPLPWIEAL
jgi:hypothetical protein